MASVKLSKGEQTLLTQAATRTLSHPDADPTTGADLGAGPGPRGMGGTKKS
jgi:Mn-containing catalase